MWKITNFNSFKSALDKIPLESETWSLKSNMSVKLKFKLVRSTYQYYYELYMTALNESSLDIYNLSISAFVVGESKAEFFRYNSSVTDVKADTVRKVRVLTFTLSEVVEDPLSLQDGSLTIMISVTELKVSRASIKVYRS